MADIYFKPRKRGFLGFIGNLSATMWIVIACVLFFIIEFVGGFFVSNFADYYALKPENILAGKYLWTLLTHIFSHAGFLHLFINMFVLISLGSLCEKIIGRKRFVWFFVISGIFAGLLSVLLAGFFGYGIGERLFGTADMYMVGASGAIFALAGLFVVLLPRLRFMIIFLPFFSLPAYIMIPIVLVITWIASIAANLPIGNVAHLGGFLAGLAYGYYLKRKYRRKVELVRGYFR